MRRTSTASVVATICRDDLLHLSRDRTALAFLFVVPVFVMVIIGATIGAGPSAVPLGLVDADGSPEAARVRQALEATGALTIEVHDAEEDVRRDVRTQSLSGGLIIPAGFGAAIRGGGEATLALIIDPNQQAGQSLATVVQSAMAREDAVLAAARFATERSGPGPSGDSQASARELAGQVPRVPVRLDSVGGRPSAADNRYTYTGVSNLVLFVFISTLAAGTALVERRQLGVTRRMMAAPVTASSIIAGTAAARLLVAVLQSGVILVIGRVAFGIQWGDTLGVLLLVMTFAALATGVSLLVGSLVRNADQALSIGIPVSIAMGMLGGTMWPLEIVPAPMQVIGHITPHAWAMDAWIKLVFESAGVAAIVPQLAVLAAVTLVLAVAASVALRRSLRNP
jgi:ABC-2 type transport system permease protein